VATIATSAANLSGLKNISTARALGAWQRKRRMIDGIPCSCASIFDEDRADPQPPRDKDEG
jgi:hypothetical protein